MITSYDGSYYLVRPGWTRLDSTFWEVLQRGKGITIRHGRVALRGMTSRKSFPSAETAASEVARLVRAKVRQGYVVERGPTAKTSSGRKATASRAAGNDTRVAGAKRGNAATSRTGGHGAGKSRTLRKPPPFLFLGHGFGTSERCLECYLLFRSAPKTAEKRAITSALPWPVAAFACFASPRLLHFGSDDDLELRVLAADHARGSRAQPRELYERLAATGAAPTPSASVWRRFCDDFERAVRSIHRKTPLVAAIKPDNGAYGRRLSRWHQESLAFAHTIPTSLLEQRRATRAQASLILNVLEDVLPNEQSVARSASSREQSGATGSQLECRPGPHH